MKWQVLLGLFVLVVMVSFPALAEETKTISVSGNTACLAFVANYDGAATVHVLWGIPGTPREDLVFTERTVLVVPPEGANTFWFGGSEEFVVATDLTPLGEDWYAIPQVLQPTPEPTPQPTPQPTPAPTFDVFLPLVFSPPSTITIERDGNNLVLRASRQPSTDLYLLWGVENTPRHNLVFINQVATTPIPQGAQTFWFAAPNFRVNTNFQDLGSDWYQIP